MWFWASNNVRVDKSGRPSKPLLMQNAKSMEQRDMACFRETQLYRVSKNFLRVEIPIVVKNKMFNFKEKTSLVKPILI